jgi:uncharacterized protein
MFVARAAAAMDTIAPSFDCTKASAEDEQAICSSRKLAELDLIIAKGYADLQRRIGKKEAAAAGGALLKRRQACKSDTGCIYRREAEFVRVLAARGAPVALPMWLDAAAGLPNQALPGVVGKCARTTIDDIGARLMGDYAFSSGTSVAFANGGYQVSYDSEPAILGSRLGDPVTICLKRLPEDCPSGDERGKEYETTNARTGKSWTLPDAQHACGGA